MGVVYSLSIWKSVEILLLVIIYQTLNVQQDISQVPHNEDSSKSTVRVI